MKVSLLAVVNNIDVPLIRQRVPSEHRQRVMDAIAHAIQTLPLDASKRVPLNRELSGLYKCPFSSGLAPGEKDMRSRARRG